MIITVVNILTRVMVEEAYGGSGFGGQGPTYGSQRPDDNSRYGGQKRQDDVDDNRDSGHPYGGHGQTGFGAQTGGYNTSYGQPDKAGYGGSKYGRDEDDRGKKSRRGDDDNDDKSYKSNQPSYGGGYGGGYGGNHNSGRSRKDKDDSDDDKRYKLSHSGRYGGVMDGRETMIPTTTRKSINQTNPVTPGVGKTKMTPTMIIAGTPARNTRVVTVNRVMVNPVDMP